jgi:phosphoribosylanthranilate isomerase
VTRVKICGITNREDALAACEAGADVLGFVFAPEARRTNRYIAPEAARRIIEELPPFVSAAAVCVNESLENVLAYLEFADYVQLHGEETPDLCRAVANRAIKAFRVGPDFRPESMLAYATAAFLLDACAADARGGTGKTCDWDIARAAVALGRPIILAGGLTPDNVAEAIRAVRPYAVDTAGGVESAPGKKDHERLRCFIHNAKTCLSR